jgi:hypothetical protein
MKKPSSERYSLPVIHNCAAGIDIGSRFHVVAVPADITKEPVQTFKAFTADLERMADWLVELGITTVAMESTGVYWIPVYGNRPGNTPPQFRLVAAWCPPVFGGHHFKPLAEELPCQAYAAPIPNPSRPRSSRSAASPVPRLPA